MLSSEWNRTQPLNCLQNKPEFDQVFEAFSMEVMGSKLAAALTAQQIYLCHRTWGLLLEASVQKAAEAFLVSVMFLRKLNVHGDQGFEKFDSEMKVGFGSYIMGTHAARLIGTNARSEEEERSPTVEASSKEISRPSLDVKFIDGPDMTVKVTSTIKILVAAKSKDEDESEDKDDDDEDDDNEEDLGEEGDEDVSSEDGGEEQHNEGNGTGGGAGEEDEDDEEDDEDGNDNNEKGGSDEDEEDEDDEDEVVEEEDDHGEEGEEEDEDDDGEDEDEKDDEEDEDEESLQPPKKRKK